MEYIVGLLAFFICFCFLLRQTENTVFALSVNTLICSLFIGMMWPIAIEQSRSEIAQWLADRSLITDLSILLMADILMQIAYTILAVRELYGVKERRWERRIRIFLRAFPGLLLFPVVFFCWYGVYSHYRAIHFPYWHGFWQPFCFWSYRRALCF